MNPWKRVGLGVLCALLGCLPGVLLGLTVAGLYYAWAFFFDPTAIGRNADHHNAALPLVWVHYAFLAVVGVPSGAVVGAIGAGIIGLIWPRALFGLVGATVMGCVGIVGAFIALTAFYFASDRPWIDARQLSEMMLMLVLSGTPLAAWAGGLLGSVIGLWQSWRYVPEV